MTTRDGNGAEGAAIAIIGMAGRFPGATDVRAFWANVRDGVESIRFFTEEELASAGESPDALRDPAYVKACGQLADIDKFDASFFGMSPRDAAVFDPQHRVFLECAWEAFEDAGYVGERFAGPVGVFGASGASEYMMYNLLPNREIMSSVGAWLVRHTGNDTNFLATRVSYELNLDGPSMSVQTACSSSLVAVHLACQSLLNGECDMALAGGTTIYPEQNRGYLYKEGEILSPDGHCRPFDAKSAGTTMASAVGCVVLKRLEDAQKDGDQVLAIIRGSAINNDGSHKVGYLAPSVSGQARVVVEALAVAGIEADDVSYIEAHGTGTLIGDPIEIAGLTHAFRASTERRQFCAIGSLKSNIGHAGEAAGIGGLIKAVLALRHKQLPPSLHYETPNPQCDFANSPFFVNAKLRDWTAPAGKSRIAGVTALGAGGTNCHLLLEEAPAAAPAARGRAHQLLVLSAKTPTALDQATKNLADVLRARPSVSMADVAYTLLEGRKGFAHRRALVCTDALDAAAALEGASPQRLMSHHKKNDAPSVVFMFPGGGAQYARMGAELYEREPVYREAIDECVGLVRAKLGIDLRTLIFARPEEEEAAGLRLQSPSLTLPSILATEYALAKLLLSWGIAPAAMIGHSAGEYAAACLAGVLSLKDAMALVALRGRLFETLPEGGMLSVSLSEVEARSLMSDDLSFAAINAPTMCVVSGPVASIAKLEQALVARDVEHARVHINVAAHSAMLEPILAEFEAFCRTIPFGKPTIPFVSNLTGTWIKDDEAIDPSYWVRHLRHSVRFGDGVRTLLETPNRVLIEIGPGRTLSSLARQQPTKALAVSTLRHPKEEASDVAFLLGTLGRLWTTGVDVDAAHFYAGEERRRVSLPTYPFERQRYWVDPDKQTARAPVGTLRKRADMTEWFYAPSWGRSAPPAETERGASPKTWLVFSDGSKVADKLVADLRDTGDDVVTVVTGTGFTLVGDRQYSIDPALRADYETLIDELRDQQLLPRHVVHMWAMEPRPRKKSFFRRPALEALDTYDRAATLYYFSFLFLAQALKPDDEPIRLTAVSSHMQPVLGGADMHPEKATLLGVCKVIPREFPQVTCTMIDVALPVNERDEDRIVTQIAREIRAESGGGEIAYRAADRWERRLDPVRLDAPPATATWLQSRGVYVITGGLGGIGLEVAAHLAKTVHARLVLVGRTPLPPEEIWSTSGDIDAATQAKIGRILAMRAMGAEVMTVSADVTDATSMEAALARARERFGEINGVFHVAGVLKDELIALRPPEARSTILDAKAKGALVLDALTEADEVDLFVVFSSISSTLGLPGQSDYTAANAFLDAFAHARAARDHGRTLSIDWNAWKEVGMLATRVRAEQEAPAHAAPMSMRGMVLSAQPVTAGHPLLGDCLVDNAEMSVFSTSLRRSTHWLLGDHVVKGGDAVIPGTGFLEIARAALEHHAEGRPVELKDVFFLSPFAVGRDDARTLHVRLNRKENSEFVMYGESEKAPFVTGKAAYVDSLPPPRIDLEAIGARCTTPGPAENDRLIQHFMDFGPRWANVRRIDLGKGEALVWLSLAPELAGDLATYKLHPGLLDMATGGAQALIPGFDPKAAFYVPLSYGRVLLRRALPPELVSHVRLREDGGKDVAVFDVALVDLQGDEIATIEGFVMRKVSDAFAAAPPPSRGVHTRPESPEAAALREGMTPAEGVAALDRILAAPFSPQVVASTVDLHVWLERLAAEAKAQTARATDAPEAGGPLFTRPSLSATFIAPRDTMERELAAMWRELLGVAEVGVDDDFFELGGQSLIAVRLFHRIGKKYGVELPLATLFQAPTIAQCAAILKTTLGVPAEAEPEAAASPAPAPSIAPPRETPSTRPEKRFRSLVTVQRGGGRIPFFCVHGAGGNVLNFRDLSRAMHRSQPFYGLQAYGVDGITPPHDSIEAMARAYLEEVREVQPHGPYLIGGYSGGGVVAFEMARLLTLAGEPLGLLALIDTFHPQMPLRRVTVKSRIDRWRSEGVPYLKEAVKRQIDWAKTHQELRTIEEHRRRGEPIPFALRDLHMTKNFENAASRYRPTPWTGRATLFRATEVAYIFAEGGPCYSWERHIIGGVEIVMVPGNHHTLLLGTNADVLVRSLTAAIENAQQVAMEEEPIPPTIATRTHVASA